MIYIVTKRDDGRAYIGQTRQPLKERWSQHVRDAKNGSTTYFHEIIREFGEDAFSVGVLCDCSDEETNDLESFCILAFNTKYPEGFNTTNGGEGVHGIHYDLLLQAAEKNLWKDRSGQTFGKLTALEVVRGKRVGNGLLVWKCLCDCGNFCEVSSNDLHTGNTSSCGCLRRKEDDKSTIKSFLAKSQSLPEIAEKMGISPEAAKARLQRLGIGTPYGAVLKDRDKKFWELVQQKKPSGEIAQTLGISQTSVRARYRRAGISVRQWLSS